MIVKRRFTKKKTALILACILSGTGLYAQIGVNTENPQALFHIDAKGNSNGAVDIDDDVVITSDGKVGVGTVSPGATLDVLGKIDFDKSSKNNMSLVSSSATGVASWKSYQLNTISIWQISGSGNTFTENTESILSGTSVMLENNIIGVSVSDNEQLRPGVTGSAVSISPGRYLIYLSGDINNVDEYGDLRVYEVGNSTPLMYAEYGLSALGVSFVLEVTELKKYYMTFTPLNAMSVLYDAPPYTATFTAGIIIHKIS